jgi:hypothetical protein
MIRTWAIIVMIAVAAFWRVIPHPPNFAPITAMCLFGGAYFTSRVLAFLVPLTAMVLSDLALELTTKIPGLYEGWLASGSGLHSGWWATYGSFALIVCIGMLLKNRQSAVTIIGASLVSSVLFFVLTNFAVWATGTLYEKNIAGLVKCYEMAIPFFNWGTMASDLVFVGILFGGFALAERRFPALRTVPA